jgi:hypothetical protein
VVGSFSNEGREPYKAAAGRERGEKIMRINLTMNGLDPKAELARHEMLAKKHRAEMAAMGKRNNWKWRELLKSTTFHEENAAKLRKEGV